MKYMRKILSAYVLSTIMLLQSYANVTLPYRVYGALQTIGFAANPALISPSLGFTGMIGAASLMMAPKQAKAEIVSAVSVCPDGYSEYSGSCIKEETIPVNVECSESGMYQTNIYDPISGVWIDSCKKTTTKNAEVICGSNQVAGGVNNQQCRTEKSPDNYGKCDVGLSQKGDKCVGNWAFPSTNKFYCAALCDVPLNSPTATCPAESDPIKNAPKIGGVCTKTGEAEGRCIEGEQIQLSLPDLQWAMESPVQSPTGSNPVTCLRSEYETVSRICPVDEENVWRFPYGQNGDDPSYYDAQTGAVKMCMRRIIKPLDRICENGLEYNPIKATCDVVVDCPNGSVYENGQCRNGDVITCPSSHTLDEATNTCVLNTSDTSFKSVYSQGADFGWQLGTLQKDLTQNSDSSGNVDLKMALLSKKANDELQTRESTTEAFQTTGQTSGGDYASIDKTYGDESEQTIAIKQNAATYNEYLNDDTGTVPVNTSAEAYGVVTNSIKNRPNATSPNAEWMTPSQDFIEGIDTGTNPWFGDCSVEPDPVKTLDLSKQIITEENCTRPVTVNYNSCQVKRHIEKPTIKIIEGMDSAKVEFLNSKTLRLTIGKDCDNCLVQRSGEQCSTYNDRVSLQMAPGLNVVNATLKSTLWDDLLTITTGNEEIFRGAASPWATSGWPSPQDSCEKSHSNSWNGNTNVTAAFQRDLGTDNIITFEYKVGVGGEGEANAVMIIEFDDDIRTEWSSRAFYEPEGCNEKIESGQCESSGWECTLQGEKNTLGMEDWFEWDSVPNWNIYDNGYAANSTLNGSWSAYGSKDDVGKLHFKGDIIMPGGDDDTVGFIFGYPKTPVWTKDPTDRNYNANIIDSDNNHYYMLLWTGNTDKNGAQQGLSLNKYYMPYTKLENGSGAPYWGINFHKNITLPDPNTGEPVTIVEPLYSDSSFKWRNNTRYKIEFDHSEYGTFTFKVDGATKISLDSDNDIKTGRFGFTSVSLENVKFEALQKVPEFDFPALWEGGQTNPMCMRGNAVDMHCDPLAGQTVSDSSGQHWSYDDLRNSDDTCGVLEDRNECSWIRTECEASSDKGECLLEREYYNCVDNSQAWVDVPVTNTCNEVLPCADGDESCETRGKEESTDFSEAITQIGVITEMRSDMECSDPDDVDTCEVFKGTKRQCSFDQFGMIDCCEEFKGKTIDLFQLTRNMWTVASFVDTQLGISENLSTKMFGANGEGGWIPDDLWGTETAIDGAWESVDSFATDVQTGVTDAWGSMTSTASEYFASEVDNAAGTVEESPADETGALDTDTNFADFTKDLLKEGIIAKMKSMAINYLTQTLAPIVVQAMVNAAVSMGIVAAQNTASTMAAAQGAANAAIGMIGSFMTGVGIAVAVIQIGLAVYQMLNGCDDDELDMPQVLKEHKCFFAYKKSCTKKFGLCMNKHRNRHCCFGSVLSRIIMEQSVVQPNVFGQTYTHKDWYEEQQCRGLKVSEIPLVDFSQIDYTEWFDLMVQSGSLPNSQETLEEMTTDSYSNPFGRSDSLSIQEERGLNDANENYREKLDKEDILGEVDCAKTPNIQSCRTGIFED